jgi:hypothetical protein
MPRPPRTAPPLELVAVKIAPELAAQLRQYAVTHGLTVSEALRQSIEALVLEGSVPPVPAQDPPPLPDWLEAAITTKVAEALAALQATGALAEAVDQEPAPAAKRSGPSARVTIRLPPDVHEALHRAARLRSKKHPDLSRIVRAALQDYLQ